MNLTIRRIFLMLGNECNLQCKYCLQHDIVEDEVAHNVRPKVYSYIIRLQTMQRQPINITFFGGEPLLFWKQIESFVDALEMYGVRFSIITNGKGLTKERIEYMNAHKISVGLSWDGARVEETRGYDVIADKKDLLYEICMLCISGVGTMKNMPADFAHAVDTFDAGYYEKQHRHVGINYDLLLDNCQNCGSLAIYDYEKWTEQIEMLVREYEEKHDTAGARLINNWIRQGRRPYSPLSAKCGNGTTVLNLDMQGNLYQCHNNHRRIGTIDEDDFASFKRMMMIDPTAKNYKTMCKDCEVLAYCKGGCMLTDQETRKRYYCELARATYGALLRLLPYENNKKGDRAE